MAHFELTTGERLWVKGSSGDEKIAIHTGNKIALRQWGGADQSGTVMPALYASPVDIAHLSDFSITGIKQTLNVESKKTGKTVLNGKNKEANDCVYPLTVVAGDYQNHSGMTVDLLAEKLGRSTDTFKIYSLQRFLNNNNDDSNLFDQKSDKNVKKYKTELACGSVASDSGKKLLGTVSDVYNSYHVPLKSISTRDDVTYEQSTIDRACAAIKTKLRAGTAVRVGTAHHPATGMLTNGRLQPTSSGGHFVLIVGCDEDARKFLYVDPWPGGSKLKYTGGMPTTDPMTTECRYLGLFTVEKLARGPVIKQHKDSEGSFSGSGYLEVIAGPL